MGTGLALLLMAALLVGVAAWGLWTLERGLRRLRAAQAAEAATRARTRVRQPVDLDAPAPWKQNLVGLDGRPARGVRARWEDWD